MRRTSILNVARVQIAIVALAIVPWGTMNKQPARNALLIAGAWSISGIAGTLITVALIPLNNRMTFSGDSGAMIMWIWSGLPEAVSAVGATVAVLWLLETKRPYAWAAALVALYVYGGIIGVVRMRAGFRSAPNAIDSAGIVVRQLLPAFASAVGAVWYQRRGAVKEAPNRL
jgi:hypothetical protein